jgi:hypothetical protein
MISKTYLFLERQLERKLAQDTRVPIRGIFRLWGVLLYFLVREHVWKTGTSLGLWVDCGWSRIFRIVHSAHNLLGFATEYITLQLVRDIFFPESFHGCYIPLYLITSSPRGQKLTIFSPRSLNRLYQWCGFDC